MRVLVVDDEEMIRFLVRSTLAPLDGVEVAEARDGESGLRTARDTLPDLVLLDVRMPGVSGIDVCRTLRSNPQTARVRVVMLTGAGQGADVTDGYRAGADGYVIKPFTPDALREVVLSFAA